jgi:hypothetical protein
VVTLIVTQKLWESGILLFDAYSRQCAVTSEYYYQADAPPPSTSPPLGQASIRWFLGTQVSTTSPLGGGSGSANEGRPTYSGSPISGSVTLSTSAASYQVKGFELEVGVDLYGVDFSTTIFSDQWSQTATHTVDDTLSWTVYGNSESVPVCYVVYGVGGSTAIIADAIGIWAYSPSGSSGD